jgi:hypothetical protein
MPASLGRTNVMGTYMIHYLIYVLTHSDSGTIMTFVYILVYIFNGFNGGTDFNIDMTIIVGGQTGVIRDDIVVVKYMTFRIGIGSTIVGSGIFWVTIFAKVGFLHLPSTIQGASGFSGPQGPCIMHFVMVA